jgi:hypothetical protein
MKGGTDMVTKNNFKIGKSSNPTMSKDDMNALIAKKAYELYEKRGRKAGHSMDDWLEAERIIKGKLSR